MAKTAIRPIRIEGNVAYVPLTRGYEAVIDAADVPVVDGKNWQARIDGLSVYAQCAEKIAGKSITTVMHRHLMGSPEGLEIDHRDGDGLNNRRENLRMATHAQNVRNRRKPTNNKSGVKGVYWRKDIRKWAAMIKLNGRNLHLGLFPQISEAAAAYARASSDLHGDFGRLE